MPAADCAWADDLLRWLESKNLITADRVGRARWPGQAKPRVTFLGHSTLLMQSAQTKVLFDPIVTRKMGSPRGAFEIFRTPLDAICCTHSHWDHCNLETLLRFMVHQLEEGLECTCAASNIPAGVIRRGRQQFGSNSLRVVNAS